MRYRYTEGPHVGMVGEWVRGYEELQAEALWAFAHPLPTQTADTYTRDGASFNREGRLVAIGGWSVEEIAST